MKNRVATESPSKGPSPETTAQPTPSSVSPDKKWEYRPDESAPKIVKAGTDEVALDLSDQAAGNGFSFATVICAPDSKRFAFNYGQGREHATSLYQLRSDEWLTLKAPGDVDEILKLADDAIKAQVKKAGVFRSGRAPKVRRLSSRSKTTARAFLTRRASTSGIHSGQRKGWARAPDSVSPS